MTYLSVVLVVVVFIISLFSKNEKFKSGCGHLIYIFFLKLYFLQRALVNNELKTFLQSLSVDALA